MPGPQTWHSSNVEEIPRPVKWQDQIDELYGKCSTLQRSLDGHRAAITSIEQRQDRDYDEIATLSEALEFLEEQVGEMCTNSQSDQEETLATFVRKLDNRYAPAEKPKRETWRWVAAFSLSLLTAVLPFAVSVLYVLGPEWLREKPATDGLVASSIGLVFLFAAAAAHFHPRLELADGKKTTKV